MYKTIWNGNLLFTFNLIRKLNVKSQLKDIEYCTTLKYKHVCINNKPQ